MKKIVLVLAVLFALVAMPAAPAYAFPGLTGPWAIPGHSVATFSAHVSGENYIQGQVQFNLTPCGSALYYKVMENLSAEVVPIVHLHLEGITDPIGTLSGEGFLIAWNTFPIPPYLYDSPTLWAVTGVKPEELYVTTKPVNETDPIHYKQLQPLVENWLVPGKAYVDFHLPGNVVLTGYISGQSNGEWPSIYPFVLMQ